MSIMTSPQKHPKSGIYYFSQSVPKECRSAIGKTEFENSLRTKNLSEAKIKIIRFMQVADQLVALARLKLKEANRPDANDANDANDGPDGSFMFKFSSIITL